MNSLLLAPELFKSEGGIARMLRLYLKGMCEISGPGDRARFLSLNDSDIDSGELRHYSNDRLTNWEAFDRAKLPFSAEAFRMGLHSDRIVCGHIGLLPLAWAVAKLRPKTRYYLVAHGIEVWRPFTFLERLALGGARIVFCVSEYTRQQVLKFGRLPIEQTAVLFNALDPGLNPPSAAAPAGGPPIILSVSRLSIADNYKGIEHLVSAMPSVLAHIPNARLRIVGRGDGLPELQSLVRDLTLSNSVEFVGYLSDSELNGEFDRCRLFALPSQKEGFGLVYLEAMAHGRPCLGARSGATPEVITAETGVLADYGDIQGIAASIVAALQRDWPIEPILERARMFSYTTFRERLATLLSA